jgi:CDP-diacylglycerol--serine O-phosphatidyltransferase
LTQPATTPPLPAPGPPAGEKPRRRWRFDLHKALFVLPNAFTASSIFCGFFAIIACTGDATSADLYRAAVAIFYGMLFDMFDGRVARLTKTQSEFGMQFDSLADVISFGVAPGVLVYKWALAPLGNVGIVVAFTYAACGAIRLARFNVLASRESGASKHFIGLPIPLAAGALVSLVMTHHQAGFEGVVQNRTVLLLVLILSYLMVSTVRYRTFKDLRFNRKSLTIVGSLLLVIVYFSMAVRPYVVMVVFVWGYLVVGMLEEVIFFRKRRVQALSAVAAAAAPAPAPPEPEEEEELEDEEPTIPDDDDEDDEEDESRPR